MADSNTTITQLPPPEYTVGDPLSNLSAIRNRVDSLSLILSNSVNGNTPLSENHSDSISAELTSAIHHIVINGAALLTSLVAHPDPKTDGDDLEIVELDMMELTAEHSHICEICGKGFKRDANLRMHMRAHGEQYKSLQSLSKPDNLKASDNDGRKTRFSCPYIGCNKNKKHREFRPLKSAVCVKNHFKRSHCPKKHLCDRCKKKRFSVLADLKSHMKHCAAAAVEESEWKCSCGGMFSKKEALFEHMSLFEGHMPAAGINSNFDFDQNCGFGLTQDDQMWSSIEELLRC